MGKRNLKKEWPHLYKPSAKKIVTVDVPEMNFLMIDGEGDPNISNDFQQAVEGLFGISYTLKFMIKKQEIDMGIKEQLDYAVMPLEGLWWADDPNDFLNGVKKNWKWTAMIMQPDFITHEMITAASKKALSKKDLPGLSKMKFKSYTEGTSAQVLYIGPFSNEGPTIQNIHKYITENGGNLCGKHHEIYLSDFRRSAPEKLKTIIRQPFIPNETAC